MDLDAYSIDQFCMAHGFCRSVYYKLQREGKGPREMRVGKRVLISKEAATDWRREREAEQREAVHREAA